MTELQLPLIFNLIVFVLLPFVGGFIAMRLRLPRMIGYIIAGIVLGWIIQGRTGDYLPVIANFGLVFLLFTVGLEVDISQIRRYGKLIGAMTLLQVGLTMVFFLITTIILGFSFIEALLTSFAFALSSTAVVSKIIQDSGEENSLIGGMVLGILILQDIIVIPFMIMLSSITSGDINAVSIIQNILFSVVKATLVLGLMFVLTQQLVPFVFRRVAELSRELLNLLTILFIFIAVYIFSFLGLSPAIAAFVSGVLIGGTLEHYQIFSQIRPLRDIFTILFFVFLGATIDVPQIMPKLPLIILFSLFVVVAKFVIITIVFLYYRFHSKTAFTSAILLSQVGEFAFIVLHQGQTSGLIADHRYMFILTSTLITIALSPLLIDRKDVFYIKLRSFTKKHFRPLQQFIAHRIDREPILVDALEITDHIVICGYGRVGSYVGRALTMANISYVAIDYNYHIVEKNRKQGVNIIYGDPTNSDILTFAQVPKATTIISAVPDSFSQEMIVLNSKRLNPNIKILTRVGIEKNQKRMKDLGAHVIVQPEFEAALSMVKKIFIRYNLPEKDIVGKIRRLKLEHGMM